MQVYVHQFEGLTTIDTLPLAAGLVVASARADATLAAAADLRILWRRDPPDAVLDRYEAPPDVLAFSVYAWNRCYSEAVAARARAAHPGALVVLGGPEVPRRPDALRRLFADLPFVDVVVQGEGELTFRELLRADLAGTPLAAVPGCAVRDARAPDGYRLTPPRPRLTDFAAVASPYLDGTFDALLYDDPPRITAALLETNRGCPFSCTFCDWGQATASRVHELPLPRVQAELDWITRWHIPYVYIVDANFGIRRRDLAIVEHLAALKAERGVPGFVFFHLTKNAHDKNLVIIEALRAAGIGCHVGLAMQDFAPRVLAAIKRDNIKTASALHLRQQLNDRGIPTFNDLILGLPEQTADSFCDSVVQALTPYRHDTFAVHLCRLLENAEMASPEDRARFGILTRRCPVDASTRPDKPAHVQEYDEVVVATATLPVADWRRAYRFGHLTACVHNYGPLRLLLRYLGFTAGVDLRGWLDHLCAHLPAAPAGTPYAGLHAVIERYTASILAGGPVSLPVAGTSLLVRDVTQALLAVMLEAYDAFLDQTEALTRAFLAASGAPAPPALAEAFAWQRFAVPRFGRPAAAEAAFDHDWLAFALANRAAPELPARVTRVAWAAPEAFRVAPTFAHFFDQYLAMVFAQPGAVPGVSAR